MFTVRVQNVPDVVWAALSGLALTAASEPFRIAPLGWIALVPLFMVAMRRRAVLAGLVCGLVYFGSTLAWIFLFGALAWTSLTVFMALFVAAAAAVASMFRGHVFAPLIAAASWAGFEWLRGSWPFGGFAWGQLGLTQAGVPFVGRLAGAVGVTGLTLVCAFASALIAHRIVSGRWAWQAAVLVIVVTVGFVLTDAASPRARGRAMTVAVHEARVPRPVVADADTIVFESALERARSSPPADLHVFPESTIGFSAPADALDRVQALARELRRPVLVSGIDFKRGDDAFRNVVRLVEADGSLNGEYAKRHPVPFGEYVPIPWLRRFISALGQVPFDMAPGRRVVVFDVDGARVGVPICFESAFPRDVRDFARAGAELIVVSTNNSSYERTWASRQHLAQARMRALELRMWVVQAALTGISGVAAPDGRLSNLTGVFAERTMRATVHVAPSTTLYKRIGDAYTLLWVVASAACGLWRGARRLSSRSKIYSSQTEVSGSGSQHR